MGKQILLYILLQILVYTFCLGANGTDASDESVNKLFEISFNELLGQTVVTAVKAPQKLNVTPATVRIVTAKQIKERGYQTLEDVLSDLPGIQFRNIQSFNSYVFMRGAPSQNNLILLLVDGIEINELNSGGFYGGGQFNLENVKQIEIVYGPASTLYGTNAMSGVINIITWEPADNESQDSRMSVAAGNFDTVSTDFRTAYYNKEKQSGFSLSGMYRSTEKADLYGNKGDNNWTTAMENFERDFAFDGKVNYRDLTFGFLYQDKRASRTTNYKTVNSDKLDYGTEWHITFMNLWLKHNYTFSGPVQLKSTLYYRDTSVEDDTIAFINKASGSDPGQQVGYYRPNTQTGIEEQLSYQPCNYLKLLTGLLWENERLAADFSKSYSSSQNQKPRAPAKPEQLHEHLFSIYLQSRLKPYKHLELTLGVRRDDSSAYDNISTPRAGLVYARDKWTGKLLYSKAFRAPKPWDFTAGSENPDLSAEEIVSLEGYLAYRFNPYFNAEMCLYKNTITDLLTFNSVDDHWENRGNLETRGFETTFNYSYKKFTAYYNYTFTDSENNEGAQKPEIARHTSNIGLFYKFNEHFKINLRGNYLGDRKTLNTIPARGDNNINGAFVVHTDIVFLDYGNWDFQLFIRNLLDKEYYHSSNRPPERYRQSQRTIIIKAGYTF
ncbi:MAG: TonB-dependent receptor [Desulfobacteraceae bacterium]|jgi:outer membrane cobalamin receptor